MELSYNRLTEEDKTQVWFTNGLHNIVAQAKRKYYWFTLNCLWKSIEE